MPTERMWTQLGTINRDAVGDLDLEPPGFEEAGERLLARTWRVFAAQGVLWVAGGVVLVAWPEPGTRTLATLTAVPALAGGLMSGIAAFRVPLLRDVRRWLALDAVVAIALGLSLLALPGLSSTALLYVIAGWAVARGVLELGAAWRLPLSGGRELLLFWGGLVSLVFGLVMFFQPAGGALALLGLIAVFAIVTGVMRIVLALELRRLVADAGERMPRRTATKPVAHG